MKAEVEEIFHAIADLSAEERDRYFAANAFDQETRQQVEELLQFDQGSLPFENDVRDAVASLPASPAAYRGALCGPYRLQRLLGSGGMGAVFLGERIDGEVTQKVAIKLLRAGANDPLSRRRFFAERQILASLSHPNISRLLDAGHREDGQPYLVMEYIHGKVIDEFADSLTIRQKIVLALKICSAIAYLHRNLVVHRDLKPANILVTDEGEPKLLDFGIAKMLDLEAESTLTGMRMLTPGYASPEQATGGPITTATDIYSLGAVFYRLFVGVSPHQFTCDSAESIALGISAAKITPPSKLVPALKGDLEIILMKALRKEALDRYTTVQQFVADLESYLTAGPISARRGDAWYRTRKFLRRQWMPMTASALVVLSLSGGLYIANQQRVLAEQRFEQLRQLSNRIVELDSAIRTLPGSLDARQRLVAASLEYLQGLSLKKGNDLELTQEVADGYWRMARIQGINSEYNLGEYTKAEQSLKAADGLMELVLSRRPDSPDALLRSAAIAHDRMILADEGQRRSDQFSEAAKTIQRLEELLSKDLGMRPIHIPGLTRPGDARESALTTSAYLYSDVALGYLNSHRYSDAIRCAQRAVELAQPFSAAMDVRAQGLSIEASALRYQGDLEGALTAIREARVAADKTSYASSQAAFFRHFAVMYREALILGEANAVSLNQPGDAIQDLQQILDQGEAEVRKNPHDSAGRSRVVTVARELGSILAERDPRRALSVFDLGIQRLEEIQKDSEVERQRERARLLALSSYPLRRLRRDDEAGKRIQMAITALQKTKDYPAEKIGLGSQTYVTLCALGDFQADRGAVAQALFTYMQLLDRVNASRPHPFDDLRDAPKLSYIYQVLGSLYERSSDHSAAAVMQTRRLQLWSHWQQKLPKNNFVRHQLEAVKSVQEAGGAGGRPS